MIWAVVVGIVLTGGIIAPVQAQPSSPSLLSQTQPPALRTVGMGDQRQLEGRIKSIDQSSDTVIVLEDGNTLTVPQSLNFNRSQLTPGASLRAQYEEREGRKVVTTIILQP
jgi:uncharacterized protein DUF1344